MINPYFYTTENQVRHFSKLKHYPRREFHKVVSTNNHVVAVGDTPYNITKKYFGVTLEYHWTYIMDLNNLRVFVPFEAGEIIKVPSVAVSETSKRILVRTINNQDASE